VTLSFEHVWNYTLTSYHYVVIVVPHVCYDTPILSLSSIRRCRWLPTVAPRASSSSCLWAAAAGKLCRTPPPRASSPCVQSSATARPLSSIPHPPPRAGQQVGGLAVADPMPAGPATPRGYWEAAPCGTAGRRTSQLRSLDLLPCTARMRRGGRFDDEWRKKTLTSGSRISFRGERKYNEMYVFVYACSLARVVFICISCHI
jgi:hypothetical protein